MNKCRQYRDDDVTIIRTHILTQVVLIRLWNKLAACRHHVSEHILQNNPPPPPTHNPVFHHHGPRCTCGPQQVGAGGHVTCLLLLGLVQSILFKPIWWKQMRKLKRGPLKKGQIKKKMSDNGVSWEEVGSRPSCTSSLFFVFCSNCCIKVFYSFNMLYSLFLCV